MKAFLALSSMLFVSLFLKIDALHCMVAVSNDTLMLYAVEDFEFVENDQYVPGYIDKKNNSMAINAAQYKKESAAGKSIFTGKSGIYDIIITTLTEIDGESGYVLYLNGKGIGTFQNPESDVDYLPYQYKWENVKLKKGDEILVAFTPHSNGKIPENDAFAYSRGRWQKIALIRK